MFLAEYIQEPSEILAGARNMAAILGFLFAVPASEGFGLITNLCCIAM